MFITAPPPIQKQDWLTQLDLLWFRLLPFLLVICAVMWLGERVKDRLYARRRKAEARRLRDSR